jgi:hypothetical protein
MKIVILALSALALYTGLQSCKSASANRAAIYQQKTDSLLRMWKLDSFGCLGYRNAPLALRKVHWKDKTVAEIIAMFGKPYYTDSDEVMYLLGGTYCEKNFNSLKEIRVAVYPDTMELGHVFGAVLFLFSEESGKCDFYIYESEKDMRKDYIKLMNWRNARSDKKN